MWQHAQFNNLQTPIPCLALDILYFKIFGSGIFVLPLF